MKTSKRLKTAHVESEATSPALSMYSESDAGENCGLLTLPEEILCMIAKHLDERDIATCELVAPSWNTAFGRPLLVRDRIAQSFARTFYDVNTREVSDDETRKLYREARRRLAYRQRGRFGASMAEYPLRDGKTNFNPPGVLPAHDTSHVLKRDKTTGDIVAVSCVPRIWSAQFYDSCVAWRLSDQFTVIDDLDSLHRELIEWPGHEELARWNEENYNPNYKHELELVGLTKELIVFYDNRELPSHRYGHMAVYHRGLKQWRTVKLPKSWLAQNVCFFASNTTVIFRATVRDGEPPDMPFPRRGASLMAMQHRQPPARKTLHRWTWSDSEQEGFQLLDLELAGQPLKPSSTPSGGGGQGSKHIDNQIGSVSHPATPEIDFAISLRLSYDNTSGPASGNVVHAKATKYKDGIPTGTVTEYKYEVNPIARNAHRAMAKYPFRPSNQQGDYILAVLYHSHGFRGDRRRFSVHEDNTSIGTVYFNAFTERFSYAKGAMTHDVWPDAPNMSRDLKTAPFVWAGMLHYNMPVHAEFEQDHPRLHKRPMDAFIRLAKAGRDEAHAATGTVGGYLPVPSPEDWDVDDQFQSRMLGDDRYLILLHPEGYVAWCFDDRQNAQDSTWQTRDDQQDLIADVTGRVQTRQEVAKDWPWYSKWFESCLRD